MDENVSTEMTILFADVAGSVELYSTLGDQTAHRHIVHFLQSMTTLVEHHQGRVIETIGDEIMCAFSDPDSALSAACAIQESMQGEQNLSMNVRVGFHSGLTSVENGHPFGDTVNVAARVVALAKAGQIMLSDYACQQLSDASKSRTRYFSDVHIKGKRTPYIIHQALWGQEDGTMMIRCSELKPVEQPIQVNQFYLRYRDIEAELDEGTELLLGRGEQCGLRVVSDAVSRIHATVKCQGGKMILTDRSTNGTYVKTLPGEHASDASELFFHHDEWKTAHSGVISLGLPITGNDDSLIYIGIRNAQSLHR